MWTSTLHNIKAKGSCDSTSKISQSNGGSKMWYRCAPKTGYLYDFNIYTGSKEATRFGLGEFDVLQLTGKLIESLYCLFIDNFFTKPSLLGKLAKNSLYEIDVVRQSRKLLPEIEKGKKKAPKERKEKKAKTAGSWFFV